MIIRDLTVMKEKNILVEIDEVKLDVGSKVAITSDNKEALDAIKCFFSQEESKTNDFKYDKSFSIYTTGNEKIEHLDYVLTPDEENMDITTYLYHRCGISDIEEDKMRIEKNLANIDLTLYGEFLEKYRKVRSYDFDKRLRGNLKLFALNGMQSVKIKDLSMRERKIVQNLVLMLTNKEILFLYHPTRYLDESSIIKLEEYLKSCNKTLLIIDNDEIFLNSITNMVLEIVNAKTELKRVKFSEYLEDRRKKYEKIKEEYLKTLEIKTKLISSIYRHLNWLEKSNFDKKSRDKDKISNNYKREKMDFGALKKTFDKLKKVNVPEFALRKKFDLSCLNYKDAWDKDLLFDNVKYENVTLDLIIYFKSRVRICGEIECKKALFDIVTNSMRLDDGNFDKGKAEIALFTIEELNKFENFEISSYLNLHVKGDFNPYAFSNKYHFDLKKKIAELSVLEKVELLIAKVILTKPDALLVGDIENEVGLANMDIIYDFLNTFGGTIISLTEYRKYYRKIEHDEIILIKSGEIAKAKRL